MIDKISDTQKVEALFGNWKETLIWSCLENIMGTIYVTSQENPTSAMAVLGDFCFFAGSPEKDLVQYKPESYQKDIIIMIPQNDSWGKLIEETYGEKAKRVTRYAMKKEYSVFDKGKLQKVICLLPPEYSLKMVDEDIFHLCKANDWSADLVSQYETFEEYKSLGIGAVVLKDGVLVSGASSYSSYQNGIEIEIDTREDYRRNGLAYVCGAKLILECLERKWYPSWDAQNKWSVALAEKLGYHFDYEYVAYEVAITKNFRWDI
ncbi:GNAT family N-acetyltransferase [Anaeromicropila populeti]|uniref:GNAT acetyltransferase n=1 Tax=Anaeromicropila populeti TaxID=37658 RepID=A0A1I6LPL6_9FIRM|nr:GNAT family N-acetyltransferase [Anaeromicropila populeti]SFS05415.1 GNAT acetyltransferase [Anaeromicropila populeti]